MEGDVTKMPTHELEQRIKELENSYAEILGNGEDSGSLHSIWTRIRELHSELERRKSS